jgi:hypothetical protein
MSAQLGLGRQIIREAAELVGAVEQDSRGFAARIDP